jgi:hypothetical protein
VPDMWLCQRKGRLDPASRLGPGNLDSGWNHIR